MISEEYPTGTALVSAVGLKLAYDMETLIAGQMKDFSGLGNHGTITGTTDVAGQFGRARDFDGVDDFIGLLTDASVQPNQLTIAVWYRSTTTTEDVIFRWRLWGYGLELVPTGELRGFLYAAVGFSDTTDSITTNDGEWHHGALTYDGTTTKLYRDGILVAESVAASGNINYGAGGLAIGREGDFDGYYWDGTIDELLIFNRTLSDAEILALTNVQLSIVNVSLSPSPANTNDDIELVVTFSGPSSGLTSYAEIGNVSKELSIDGPVGKAIFRGRDIGAGTHSVNVAAVDGVEGDKDP